MNQWTGGHELNKPHQITCSVCQKTKTRILIKRYPSGAKRFEDEKGNYWFHRKCPPCWRLQNKKKNKYALSYEDYWKNPVDPIHKKAKAAEVLVSIALNSVGIRTQNTSGYGSDITFWINDKKYTIEVKTSWYSKTEKKWLIKKVTRKEDFLAIVFPTKQIYICPLPEQPGCSVSSKYNACCQFLNFSKTCSWIGDPPRTG